MNVNKLGQLSFNQGQVKVLYNKFREANQFKIKKRELFSISLRRLRSHVIQQDCHRMLCRSAGIMRVSARELPVPA